MKFKLSSLKDVFRKKSRLEPMDTKPRRSFKLSFPKLTWFGRKRTEKLYHITLNDVLEMQYDSVEGVEKRQIPSVIYNKCVDIIGRDYFYVYSFDTNAKRAVFVAFASKRYLVGKSSRFFFPLAVPGLYFTRIGHAGGFWIIDSRHGFSVLQKRFLEEKDREGIDLDALSPTEIPNGLTLKWSLAGKASGATIFSGLALLLAVATGFAGVHYLSTYKADFSKQQSITTSIQNNSQRLPNLLGKIKSIEGALQESGIIQRITIMGTQIRFEVKFQDSSKAQVFQKQVGGQIENDKVIYSANLF